MVAAAMLVAATPARSVVGTYSSNLLQRLETWRGHALTADQRREFTRIVGELRQALGPAHEKFARTVAQIFRLSPGQLQAIIPSAVRPGAGDGQDVMSRIEASLGRSIRGFELQQLRIADNTMQAEANEILDRYAEHVAAVTGIGKDQVRRLFPAMGI